MIKSIAILFFIAFSSVICFGQKATSVNVSTTTDLKTAMHICKKGGEMQGLFSEDYGDRLDSFTMLGSFIDYEKKLQHKISVKASTADNKTLLKLRVPHLASFYGGYESSLIELTNVLKRKLANIEVGEIIVIKE